MDKFLNNIPIEKTGFRTINENFEFFELLK